MSVTALRLAEAAEGIFDSPRPLLPEGRYQLALAHHETHVMFKGSKRASPKLTLWLRLCEPGTPYFGLLIPRYYNVRALTSKEGRGGRFKAGWGSDLAIEYCELFKPLDRLDRISLANFRNHILIGEVRTVERNALQRELPSALRYSVVGRLIGIQRL